MKKLVASLVVFALLIPAVLTKAADVESGLKPGDFVGAFNVKDVTGPAKGKSLCYRCRYGSRPVVSIFARELNSDVSALVKQVDDLVGNNRDKKMAPFVVVLTDKVDSEAAKLTKVAEEKGIRKTPLTIFDGVAGPPEYKISKDAAVTVMMWVDGTVAANHVFADGKISKKAAQSVLVDMKKILD